MADLVDEHGHVAARVWCAHCALPLTEVERRAILAIASSTRRLHIRRHYNAWRRTAIEAAARRARDARITRMHAAYRRGGARRG